MFRIHTMGLTSLNVSNPRNGAVITKSLSTVFDACIMKHIDVAGNSLVAHRSVMDCLCSAIHSYKSLTSVNLLAQEDQSKTSCAEFSYAAELLSSIRDAPDNSITSLCGFVEGDTELNVASVDGFATGSMHLVARELADYRPLTYLNMSGNTEIAALSPDFVRALEELQLSRIDLSDCGLTICDVLAAAISRTQRWVCLNLLGNQLDESQATALIAALEASQTLTSLCGFLNANAPPIFRFDLSVVNVTVLLTHELAEHQGTMAVDNLRWGHLSLKAAQAEINWSDLNDHQSRDGVL
jgi:hypothetical protein